MSVAVIRPSSWELPLLLHVAGAMVLVGSLVLALSCLVLGRRDGGGRLTWLGLRALLVGALPGFVVMRAAAEWIKSKEHAPDDASWIGIGYSISDGGLLLLLVGTLLAGLALRRLRRASRPASGLETAASVVLAVNVAAYLVAIWAMTTKPG